MLCLLCLQLTRTDYNRLHIPIKHHLSYEALNRSTKSGCGLCSLFRDSLLDHNSVNYGSSVEEAEQYEYRVDNMINPPAFEVNIVPGPPLRYDPRMLIQRGHMLFGFVYQRSYGSEYGGGLEGRVISPFITACPGHTALEPYFVGRKISAQADIDLAKSWLEDCNKEHSKCRQSAEGYHPTRLIDVGHEYGSFEPHIVLGSGVNGRYVTLSHCWGDIKPLVTTTINLAAHMERLDYQHLPKTFQDAVKVTQSLGVRYLWIDSLCILQDSVADWREQCVAMPQIYSNSLVTLAGPKAFNPLSGFLHVRNLPDIAPLKLHWHFLGDKTRCPMVLVYQRNYFCPRPELNSILQGRAWILQERLLSPRVLYFGSEMMYWECNEKVSYEVLGYAFEDNFQNRDMVEKLSFKVAAHRNSWLSHWYRIVMTFSEGKLTRATDKFPALSGVARMLRGVLGDTYVAGLWSGDIPRGLSWFVRKHDNPQQESQGYIAPSWSPASTSGQILYLNTNPNCQFHDNDFTVLSHQLQFESEDSLGQLTSAKLRIYGRIRKAMLKSSKQIGHALLLNPNLIVVDPAAPSPPVAGYYPDNPDTSSIDIFDMHENEHDDNYRGQTREIRLLCLGRFKFSGTSDKVASSCARTDNAKVNDATSVQGAAGTNSNQDTIQQQSSDASKVQRKGIPVVKGTRNAYGTARALLREAALLVKEDSEEFYRSVAAQWLALAVEPVAGESNTFRRIGLVMGAAFDCQFCRDEDSVQDVRDYSTSWFEGYDEKTWIDLV